MPDSLEQKPTGSASAGSPGEPVVAGPSSPNNVGGEPQTKKVDLSQYIPKSEYEEATKKLGEQGSELGEYRKFFGEVSPLLDKLYEQPDLVEAIMEGKVDSKIVQMVVEGKLKAEDAVQAAVAQQEVKGELGAKKFDKTSPEEIEKMILEKVDKKFDEISKSLKNDQSATEDRKDFEDKTAKFVANATDFPEYAEAIGEWFLAHPDQYDIEIAYNAVKGQSLVEKATKETKVQETEEAKRMAANAPVGGSMGATKIKSDDDLVDNLISPTRNPNLL